MNIALTLHRIAENNFIDHEDISIEKFIFILDKIDQESKVIDKTNSNKQSDSSWLLTFDDGFSSDVEIVLPLLKSYNLKAAFFIVTSFIGKPNYLSKEQILELSNSGMNIGSHSVNHYDMLSLSIKDRAYELNKSKDVLEEIISNNINLFSFPYGRYNNTIVSEAYNSGYEYCYISKPGVYNTEDKLIPRVSLNGKMSKKDISLIINSKGNINKKDALLYMIRDFVKYFFGMKNYWRLRNILLGNKNNNK